MATQHFTIATIAGRSAEHIFHQYDSWQRSPTKDRSHEIDRLCDSLCHDAGLSHQVLYFSNWIDLWSMGDLLPGLHCLAGHRFQIACLNRVDSLNYVRDLPLQFPEQQWFSSRLWEAATAGRLMIEYSAIVIVRKPLGTSATDEEIEKSFDQLPAWLVDG